MSEYKPLSVRECAEKIVSLGSFAVRIHVRPDGDAVGSACALVNIARQLGCDSFIVSCDKIPERLEFITEYTKTDVRSFCSEYPVVAIDVASPSQLGEYTSEENAPALMIDHHAIGTPFADNLTLPELSSAGEVLYRVAEELIDMGKIKMTKSLAFALYSSISSDTGRFSYSNTSPDTHRIAAFLMEAGIDASEINHRLFSSKTEAQIRAEGLISSKIKTAKNGKISYATLTIRGREELGLSEEDFEVAIDIVRSLKGAEIAVFIRETEQNKFKASLRSVEADVASVAKKFGGGGHIKAAGCSLKADSIEFAMEMLLSELCKL